ncbi:cytochrome P450 [Pseudolysinimonas sp.]
MSTEAPATCPAGYHGYEPFDMNDPFPSYERLRDEQPIMYDDRIGYWIVSRYADVKAVFDDWETFSSENAQAPVRPRGAEATRIMNEGGFTAYSGLSARIPPEHTRIRAIAQRAFTPRRYKALEPAIRANAARLISEMLSRADRNGDIVRDLAYDIPTITILSLLGVPADQVSQYKRWSDSRAAMTWGDLSDDEQIPHAHNLVDYWKACQDLVAKAHESGGDNLVADLVRAQGEGAEITDHEIASLAYSLLFAGHETTTTLIANTVRVLLGHRVAWEGVVADPGLIPAAIDETLRYSGSILAWRRKALRDTEIGGVPIPEGSNILLVMGSANRDAEVFDDPDAFDIHRDNARSHLSFGFGIHYCLGNQLAKLQDRIVIEELTTAVPSLRLANNESIEFGPNLSFRAPKSVPVSWEAA